MGRLLRSVVLMLVAVLLVASISAVVVAKKPDGLGWGIPLPGFVTMCGPNDGTPTNWAMETRREEPAMRRVHGIIGGAQVIAGISFVAMEGPRDGEGPPEDTSGES